MSEQTSNPTSGQSVPKSRKSKFRQKSQQQKTAESKLRMERRGEKLDAARKKLAKQKPLKPKGPVRRVAGVAGRGVHGFVHGKIYEVEHENVGTEGAHRTELAGETVLRHGTRFVKKQIREHPARAVRRAESRHTKATADYYYRKTVEEHPEMQKGGALSRYLQKQKIKRQYAKQVREAAKQGGKTAEKAVSSAGKLTEKVVAYAKEHPVGLLAAALCLILLLSLQSCLSSMTTVGNGLVGAVAASTYPSEDGDMLAAEAAYVGMENELRAGGYRVTTKEGTFDCQKLVLAAGLSNRRFVQFAMPTLPVYADKGQVLLVERMPFVMPIPVLGVTQTFGGTTIIGFRHEKAGHHTQVVPSAVASEGKWAIRVWPELGKKRLIRAWAGLRVMPDDSMAIYSRLPGHPNVTLVNTHSAVTMAAAHTRLLPDFILGGELPETAQGMTLKRFGYSC